MSQDKYHNTGDVLAKSLELAKQRIGMSQDKPYGFDEFAKYVPKPVAAQEPVGEIVTFGSPDCKEVSWRKGKMPEVGTKLYDHAAPCARCAEAERIEAIATAKLGNEIIKNGTLQDKITEQAERIKALEADLGLARLALEQKKELLASCEAALEKRDTKLAKADAVIEVAKVAMKRPQHGMPELKVFQVLDEALAAIEAYQKGE